MSRRRGDDALALLLLLECGEESETSECNNNPRSRKVWVREALQKRSHLGEFVCHFQEERVNGAEFFAVNRMSPERFEEILAIVAPRLQKQDTTYRKSIPPAERLALTVR